jgi:hypothetical protein
MAPLACDPTALERAGVAVLAAGVSLGSVVSALSAALASSAGMAGDDPVGAALGRKYDGAAAKLIDAMASTRNGLCSIGDGVRVSAHNYALVEAMSDVTGRAAGLPTPPVTAPLTVGAKPPSAVGAGSGAPAGWGWVAPYIGMIWPSGDSAKLRAAAAARPPRALTSWPPRPRRAAVRWPPLVPSRSRRAQPSTRRCRTPPTPQTGQSFMS